MKKDLHVIHNDQLIELIEKLGFLEELKAGKIKCKFTGTIITFENLHSIFPESGSIKFVCDSPEAIKLLSEYINEKKIK